MPPIDDTVKGFIEEVKSYIDPITEGLQIFNGSPDQWDTLEEIHRLVHTIKGASSLLDFKGLSHIAGEMEKALDDLFSGEITFSEGLFHTMMETVSQIQTYCDEIMVGDLNEEAMLKETISVYRRIRNLPADGDAEAFNKLWESNFETASDAFETEYETPDTQEDFFNELIQGFYLEAEEHMENMARFLNHLDAQVENQTLLTSSHREAIAQVRRSVHTVKGAAGMVKLDEISKWAHEIEDLLDWLYEEAEIIDKPLISLLYEATDMLGLYITAPSHVEIDKIETMRRQFKAMTGAEAAGFKSVEDVPADTETEVTEERETAEILEPRSERVDLDEFIPTAELGYGKTLRINTEKVDDLVNLSGELSIALSGCEQKMELFTSSLNELELSRDRLRTIARDLETDYEVKAIQGLGTSFASAITDGSSALQTGVFEEFDSLELDRYTEFNLMVRSLAESVVDIGAINSQMLSIYSDLEGFLNRQRVLLSELQNNMMLIRMTPMASISNRMRQTVREVSRDLEKQVKLIIEGEEIELDRQIWDKITDPLMHILRNSIDHGIESQEERLAAGKPGGGTIKVWAAREGNQVVIRIADDGKGIDYEEIRETARRSAFTDRVEEMSDEELALMIFEPGFSTRHHITQFSGRGVGMDVVKENIESLKGTVSVHSLKGQGVQFTIRIPLTLAVVEAILFNLGKNKYAVPLNDVVEVFRVDPGSIRDNPENEIEIEGDVLPLFNLTNLLIRDNEAANDEAAPDYKILLVLKVGGKRIAVAIENMIGKQEIVIKSLGSHLKHVKGVSGATILGDGSIIPILNVEELIGAGPLVGKAEGEDFKPLISKPLEILVVDDSVSVRQVVARLLKIQGWKTMAAKDGIEALEVIRERQPDLIILDIEMPRMNGYEFLNTINAQPRFKDTPVIMLTSRATSKHREKAVSLGAKGFVVKPYKDDEFIDIILKLTGEGT